MQSQQTSTQVPTAEFHGDMVWKCPVATCGEAMEFSDEEGNVIGFLIIHHLVRHHGYSRSQVLEYDKALGEAANEYIGFPRDNHGNVI